jgi:hypothetical protein
MKTKLTLSVEGDVIPRAKRYAEARGTSLSDIVESALRRMTASTPRLPFGTRWRGKFAIKPKDVPRYKSLAARYGL